MRSLIRSRLLLSGHTDASEGMKIDREYRSLTKETEIAGVDDRFCIGFAREIIESRETATNVSDAEDATMNGVKHFCLRIDLVQMCSGTG